MFVADLVCETGGVDAGERVLVRVIVAVRECEIMLCVFVGLVEGGAVFDRVWDSVAVRLDVLLLVTVAVLVREPVLLCDGVIEEVTVTEVEPVADCVSEAVEGGVGDRVALPVLDRDFVETAEKKLLGDVVSGEVYLEVGVRLGVKDDDAACSVMRDARSTRRRNVVFTYSSDELLTNSCVSVASLEAGITTVTAAKPCESAQTGSSEG